MALLAQMAVTVAATLFAGGIIGAIASEALTGSKRWRVEQCALGLIIVCVAVLLGCGYAAIWGAR